MTAETLRKLVRPPHVEVGARYWRRLGSWFYEVDITGPKVGADSWPTKETGRCSRGYGRPVEGKPNPPVQGFAEQHDLYVEEA